jgi:hypothetical protein
LPGGTTPDAVLTDLFGKDYQDRFAANYGEEFEKDVVQPLLERVIKPLQYMQGYIAEQQQQQIRGEISGFFKGLGPEFGDFYGADGRLNREQDNLRYSVCQLADQIRTGAYMQGVPMSLSEALESAHLQVAGEFLGNLERRRITQQVRARSSRITAPPTRRNPLHGPNAGDKSEAAAAQAAALKMAEIGLSD